MAVIKFCENNYNFGTDELMRKLQESCKDAEVSTESCLGYCGDCSVGPFALVDDEMIQADTAEELYEKIKAKL